ncbi:nitrite/sulfite reductase ferredoxin domain protein [delta proteobacterium NaphS2]|nr:nitrite/sulfite reductase ferredoxin domain protein [delta proteobacterium NaphS2]
MGNKKSILEKGALIQRDRETYAIVPDIKGGLCTPEILRKIADISEKYELAAVKLTSAARIALVGIKEEDIDPIWEELGMKSANPVGLCVRSVKLCPGTTFCTMGQQDAVSMGIKLDETYCGMQLPSKFKMGVSGCPNCCAESYIKDLGLIGTKKGWRLVVGGNAASRPSLAQQVADELTDDEAMAAIDKIMTWYKNFPKKQRLNRVLDDMGIDQFKEEVGL